MAITLTVEISITVNDDTQAEKIMDAVSNGLAETAIKDRVLYGGMSPVPMQSVDAMQTQPINTSPTFTSPAKAAEASKKLRPVEVRVPKGKVSVPEPEPKPERGRGILGRRQLSRTGGN